MTVRQLLAGQDPRACAKRGNKWSPGYGGKEATGAEPRLNSRASVAPSSREGGRLESRTHYLSGFRGLAEEAMMMFDG